MPVYETKQRKKLLSCLSRNADKPLSVTDIYNALEGEDISLSAIYRNLSSLIKAGKVQRITVSGDKKVYYRYTGAKKCEEHLHLSCSKCGKTFHMDAPATNSLINEVLAGSNFKIDKANTVIYGVCKKCMK